MQYMESLPIICKDIMKMPLKVISKKFLETFLGHSMEDVHKIIKNMAPKHSKLDPLPTWLVKECLDEFLPIITAIVNNSGSMPDSLKHAVIKPLLKTTRS